MTNRKRSFGLIRKAAVGGEKLQLTGTENKINNNLKVVCSKAADAVSELPTALHFKQKIIRQVKTKNILIV